MVSALIGQPPITDEDFWIVKGLLRLYGSDPDPDPSKGIPIPPARPQNAQYGFKQPEILGLNAMCLILVITITGGRLLIRALKPGLRWGWDDWFIMLAAIVISTWFSLALACGSVGGYGKHMWDITYHELYMGQKFNTAATLLYIPGSCLVKISITFFNRRITGLASKTWRLINDVLLCIIVSYMISYTIYLGARCPTQRYSLIKVGKMKNYVGYAALQSRRLSYSLGGLHVLLDFCLLSTPIIVLWKVKMARSKKMRPLVVFFVGSISCLGALMIPIMEYSLPGDLFYNFLQYEVWIILDLLFGITVAPLPVLYGSLPKAWRDFELFTRSHFTRSSHGTIPESTSGKDRLPAGVYHHIDLDSKSYCVKLDDELELLERREKGKLNEKTELSSASVGAADSDPKMASQRSRNESPV